jgi:hypothetical protein
MRPALAVLVVAALAIPATASAAPAWLPPVDVSPQDVSIDDSALAMDDAGNALAMWDHPTAGLDSVYVSARGPGQAFPSGVAISAAGGYAYGPDGAFDGAGNAIVVFQRFNGMHYIVQAGFRPAGGSFGPPVDLSGAGQHAGAQVVAMNPAGDAVVAWTRSDGTKLRVQASVRPAGGSFQPAVELSLAGQHGQSPSVAIDDAGNAIVAWARSNGTNTIIQASRRPAGQSFGPAGDVSAAGQDAAGPSVVMNASGEAIVGWVRSDGTNSRAQWSYRAQGGVFTTPQDLSAAGQNAASPLFGIDDAGNAVALWSRSNGTNPIVQAATRPAGGTFGPGVDLSEPGQTANLYDVAMNGAGHAVTVWNRSNGTNTIVQASVRSPGGAFGPPKDLSAPGGNGADPAAGIDDQGNAVAFWQRYNGTRWIGQASTYDVAPPELRDVSVPATGTVGVPVSFAATPFDRWSAVTAPEWTTGDGATRTGASITHTYSAPGTYTVELKTSDAAGNATSTSRPITIGQPAAAVPPPVLSGLRVSPSAFRAGRKARIRFTLDRAAKVRFTFQRRGSGRRVGGKCVAAKRSNRTRPSCVRYTAVQASFTRDAKVGANSVAFTSKLRKLRNARYRVAATPAGGRAVRARFRVR